MQEKSADRATTFKSLSGDTNAYLKLLVATFNMVVLCFTNLSSDIWVKKIEITFFSS